MGFPKLGIPFRGSIIRRIMIFLRGCIGVPLFRNYHNFHVALLLTGWAAVLFMMGTQLKQRQHKVVVHISLLDVTKPTSHIILL